MGNKDCLAGVIFSFDVNQHNSKVKTIDYA